jgi:hypothetical protein
MNDTDNSTRQIAKAVLLVALAVAVGFSWLGLGAFVEGGPQGFAVSNAGSDGQAPAANATETASNVTLDELRESLSRTNRGESKNAMTAIWATEAYFAASDISAEEFRVSPGDNHVFIVFLNTHSGALPDMDWAADASLRVDGTAYEPTDGYTRAGGFHHMVAVVQFPKTVDGQPVLDDGTGNVTLRVVGIERTVEDVPDDRPRDVSWQYPPAYYGISADQIADADCNCTDAAEDDQTASAAAPPAGVV